MKYRVSFHADDWHRLSPRSEVPGEQQVVEQVLEDNRRLYVELVRYPWSPVQVAVARIAVPVKASARRRTPRSIILVAEQLELVEVRRYE